MTVTNTLVPVTPDSTSDLLHMKALERDQLGPIPMPATLTSVFPPILAMLMPNVRIMLTDPKAVSAILDSTVTVMSASSIRALSAPARMIQHAPMSMMTTAAPVTLVSTLALMRKVTMLATLIFALLLILVISTPLVLTTLMALSPASATMVITETVWNALSTPVHFLLARVMLPVPTTKTSSPAPVMLASTLELILMAMMLATLTSATKPILAISTLPAATMLTDLRPASATPTSKATEFLALISVSSTMMSSSTDLLLLTLTLLASPLQRTSRSSTRP